jgi:hypothetical protein
MVSSVLATKLFFVAVLSLEPLVAVRYFLQKDKCDLTCFSCNLLRPLFIGVFSAYVGLELLPKPTTN